MSAALQVTIIYAEEFLLQLRVRASNDVFTGQTEVWVNVDTPAWRDGPISHEQAISRRAR